MGKRKEIDDGDSALAESSPHKKHKKHKKHKHKKKHHSNEDDEDTFVEVESVDEVVKPTIKLKIKLGGQSLGSKSGSTGHGNEEVEAPPSPPSNSKKGKKNKDDDDTSDEEREWLEALEKGNLDDNGELRREKDISLLTTRQRALLHGMTEESLLELPSGYKSTEITEEQLKKRQQRAKKRREQAHEKREKDKKQTLDRLLKKQDTRSKKGRGAKRVHTPGFRYINNPSTIAICVPQGTQLPFSPQPPKQPLTPTECGIEGCHNAKKYSCSKTGVPLCSLECYKRNLTKQNEAPLVSVT